MKHLGQSAMAVVLFVLAISVSGIFSGCGNSDKDEATPSIIQPQVTSLSSVTYTPEPTPLPTPQRAILTPDEIVILTANSLKTIPGAAEAVDILMADPMDQSSNEGMKSTADANQAAGDSFSRNGVAEGQDITNILWGVRSAAYEISLIGSSSSPSPFNQYGNVGILLASLACKYSDNQDLVSTWLAIRDWQAFTIAENMKINPKEFPPNSTVFVDNYFNVPGGCKNPYLASYQEN